MTDKFAVGEQSVSSVENNHWALLHEKKRLDLIDLLIGRLLSFAASVDALYFLFLFISYPHISEFKIEIRFNWMACINK